MESLQWLWVLSMEEKDQSVIYLDGIDYVA